MFKTSIQSIWCIGALILMSTGTAPSIRAAPGDIYNLGTLPGGHSSGGNAINNLGQVTGSSSTGTSERGRGVAFLANNGCS